MQKSRRKFWCVGAFVYLLGACAISPSRSPSAEQTAQQQHLMLNFGRNEVNCSRDGATVTGLNAILNVMTLKGFLPARDMAQLKLAEVVVKNGEVAFVAGDFWDPALAVGGPPPTPTSLPAHPEPDPNAGSGTGVARLTQGTGAFEIELRKGQLRRYRTAPPDTDEVFDGRWQKPGEDPAAESYMNDFLAISRELVKECQKSGP